MEGTSALKVTRAKAHPHCFVCGSQNPIGLNLEFFPVAGGGVEGVFHPNDHLQGYKGLLHGGVIASLLDGAMTNCLFANGQEAVTAELIVRYRHPVDIGEPITVRAWVEKSYARVQQLRAELAQSDCVKVTAAAKFMSCRTGDNESC
jgi:uncharacterized protein (TIGR00369 family)